MSQRELNVHRRRMHNKTPFPCLEPGCDRRNARGYVRETDLRSHQRKKHSRLSQSDETKLIGADGSNQSADTISTVMREPETAVGRPLESERARPTRAETRGSTQAISGTVIEEEEVFRVIDNVAENNDSSSTFAPSVETAHPRGDYSATDHNPAEDDDSFSASDYPRSPSPWQEMQRRVVDEHDNDAKANITHCMKWILHNRLPLMDQQSRFDVRSITDVDESGYDAASTVTEDTSGGSSPTDAGASSNGSPSAAPCLSFGRTSSLGKRATGSQEEGSDQSPGDNRDLKRARTDSFLVPDGKHIRSRRIETGAMKLFTVSNSMYSKIMTPSCGAIGAGAISKLRTMSQAIKKKKQGASNPHHQPNGG
ncbi:hypothetical protein H2201_001652 [Coniosporium apollinis]|uniref:C2H2-type domain-containing protein n=1 Tax=Coniosporium apollinis TaxID=61459 RepID=A0ABQ9P2I0_9PEZI|nr:hypothetical protein H2201_001652 [Coniosporium apollinis]